MSYRGRFWLAALPVLAAFWIAVARAVLAIVGRS